MTLPILNYFIVKKLANFFYHAVIALNIIEKSYINISVEKFFREKKFLPYFYCFALHNSIVYEI